MASTKKRSKRKEGKHVPEIFCRLRTASTNCLQSSLSAASGHCQDPPDSKNLTGSCMQIMRLGRQIRQQLMDMKTELQIRSSSKENIDASLNISLKMAHVPLEREVVSVKNKEIALLRMQSYHALLNDLKDSMQDHSVMAVLIHATDLCKKIQAVHSSNRQLEEKLVDVQRCRMEMRIKQQQLFKQLKTYEERNHKLHDLEMKTQVLGRENMESVYNKVIVIQEIFQRFILSAEVNWAEDPHLTHLLLKIKEHPMSHQDQGGVKSLPSSPGQ